MSASDFDLLARYWAHEPWGPWRDNVHAAMIAKELRNLRGGRVQLDAFMLVEPIERQTKARGSIMAALKAVAKVVRIPSEGGNGQLSK